MGIMEVCGRTVAKPCLSCVAEAVRAFGGCVNRQTEMLDAFRYSYAEVSF